MQNKKVGFLDGTVNEQMVAKLESYLNGLQENDILYLHISTHGGDTTYAEIICSMLRNFKERVIITPTSIVASSGFIILVTSGCKIEYKSGYSFYLVHHLESCQYTYNQIITSHGHKAKAMDSESNYATKQRKMIYESMQKERDSLINEICGFTPNEVAIFDNGTKSKDYYIPIQRGIEIITNINKYHGY